jgi:hypothetical protein
MQTIRQPTPIKDLVYYNPNRAGPLPMRSNRVARRPVSAFGDLGSTSILPSGYVVSGTPDQVAATLATMIAPFIAYPSQATTPADEDLADAVATIGATIPQVSVSENLMIPAVNGTEHTALSDIPLNRNTGLAGFSALGNMGTTTSLVSSGAAIGASAIAIDVGIGAFAGPIGAAVGLVVGIIMGLFAKKAASPPTTQAQIQQAQTFISTYKSMAGTVIGRAYPLSTMQDMAMAFCINADVEYNNAGGCGDQAGIQNTWNEQLARLNLFFTACAANPVGTQITLRDIPSLPGHGNTNMNVTFSFPNPGAQAPNYILAPYYAQYFYTMCNIFQDSANCAGLQLTSPVPQFYCDLIDWYRAQYSSRGWDIPPGTVDAPVEYQNLTLAPGQVNNAAATAATPSLTLAAVVSSPLEVGASLTENPNGTATSTGGAVVPVAAPVPGVSAPANSALTPGGAANYGSCFFSGSSIGIVEILIFAGVGLMLLSKTERK